MSKIKDLEKQKEKIEKQIEKIRVGEKPKKLEKIDWSKVIQYCVEYIDEVEENGGDDDSEHYLYEVVIEAVFGEKVWDWINDQTE